MGEDLSGGCGGNLDSTMGQFAKMDCFVALAYASRASQ